MVENTFKVCICFLVFILIIITALLKKKKENFENLSFPYISTKKKIIVGGKNDIENGDISVDGYTVANGICIEDDDGSVSNCIDSGNFDKIINNPHKFKKQICIDKSLCLTEHDAQYLKNLQKNLQNKSFQMKHKMFNSKPSCNWFGQRYFCGDTHGWADDYNVGCFNNKIEYIQNRSGPHITSQRMMPALPF